MTTYDVFLSHATADKPVVETLARRLREDGLEPFLDKWHLVPGEPWQEALEDALDTSRTCAVFVGTQLGPWQNEEMRAVLDKRVHNENFRVIPVLLPGTPKPRKKELPRFLHRLAWVDFCNGVADEESFHQLVCGIRGVPPDARPASAAPTPYRSMARPPDQFVHRRELDAARDLLVGAAGSTVGITTALRGAGGFGKTALAQALCEDPAVREAYPAGILWGQMRDDMRAAGRLAVVQDVIRFWHAGERLSFETLSAASARLREVLHGQRVLMVLDDAWRSADVEPFRGLGPGTALLVTSRAGGTLPADCRRVAVDAMQLTEAVTLLVAGLEVDRDEQLDALARRLGKWPLLLRLVNRQLRKLMDGERLSPDEAIAAVEDDLDVSGVTAFDIDDPTSRNNAVKLTLNASLRHLEDQDQQRFQELAVFPEDTDVPLTVLERFWGLGARAVRQSCKRFDDLALLLRFDRGSRTIRLHDVVRQYLLDEHPDLPGLHRRLLDHCRPTSGRWGDLEDHETYLWRQLADHLVEAGDRPQLRRILLYDLEYLEGKLRTVGINALLVDFDVLAEPGEARTLQEALRLSAHVLSRDWGKLLGQVLAGQLLGRCRQVGEQGRLLLQRAADRAPLRPRWVRMCRPGGPLIYTLEGHTEGVLAVAVLDDKRVLSASADKTLRLWDLDSRQTIRTLEGHTHQVVAVAVLDDKRVVSASADKTLRIWDLDSGQTIRTLEGHTGRVRAVVVLDERCVVSASDDKTLRVWNLDSGETRTLEGHTAWVRAVAVLDDKRLVSASSSDPALRVWDLDSGKTIRTLEGHIGGAYAVAVLGGNCVVSASFETLYVWDLDSGKTISTLEGHIGVILAVAQLDAKHVLLASSDHTLRVWDVESGDTLRKLEGHTSRVNAVAVLDDKRVVSASSDKTLRVWDLNSDETIRKLKDHTGGVEGVAVLDDKRAVSASSDSTLRIWDLDSGDTLRTLKGHTSRVQAVAVLDDKRMVSASEDQTLRVWDVESGDTIRKLEGHTNCVFAVAVLDDKRVVSVSEDQTLRVWDVESGDTIRKLEGHTDWVVAVATLGDRHVVSASHDNTLRLWDVESGHTIRTFEGHTTRVNAVVVLNDQRVFSASDDQTMRVWNVDSGETVAAFALDAPVLCVAVTPDGRRIVAGDGVGGVHFLDLELPD